ncbi:MAG: tRNA (guanosine(37)-N1)-methyltransferase TrmD [Acidobacteria bacterium]|nr:tRNA (guanosine(37)-N1)-methyltransferase TrmD [Acidobacteriota bacterium]
MRIDIVTIFPAMVRAGVQDGVLGRAVASGLIDLRAYDLRDFTSDRHKVVDDTPFGGGPGMVLKAEPFFRAVEHLRETRGTPDAVLLPSPQGRRFTQVVAEEYSRRNHLVILCGRYEGVDERVSAALVTEEVSIGDFVLSGGELPALVLVDAVARLVPGVVGDAESVVADSFTRGLLDHPHYTRPASFHGLDVPEVLLSGHHGEIARWRRQQALRRTYDRRPDLLRDEALTDQERTWLAAWMASEKNGAES